ncbi:hypothetical protein ACFQ6N_32850 [Kitasatospora sp. NPDC056446]|uniref:hypothetical protein n=1 Tax=Kitasatospora sp. NPDC056446 TaxID=3345819 RepID=UPI00368841FC
MTPVCGSAELARRMRAVNRPLVVTGALMVLVLAVALLALAVAAGTAALPVLRRARATGG